MLNSDSQKKQEMALLKVKNHDLMEQVDELYERLRHMQEQMMVKAFSKMEQATQTYNTGLSVEGSVVQMEVAIDFTASVSDDNSAKRVMEVKIPKLNIP